jgi:hypothetical protein
MDALEAGKELKTQEGTHRKGNLRLAMGIDIVAIDRHIGTGVFVNDIGGQFRINMGAMVASDRDRDNQIWGPIASEKEVLPQFWGLLSL